MENSGEAKREYHARKRILVTGGAGFVGSHLCDALLEAGHEVLCADNFFTGNKANIEKLLDHPYFELIRHDVTFTDADFTPDALRQLPAGKSK